MALSARAIGEILLVKSSSWTGDRPGIVTKVTSNSNVDVTVFLAPGDAFSQMNQQYRVSGITVFVQGGGSGALYAEENFSEAI
jgi:hypothetical protein